MSIFIRAVVTPFTGFATLIVGTKAGSVVGITPGTTLSVTVTVTEFEVAEAYVASPDLVAVIVQVPLPTALTFPLASIAHRAPPEDAYEIPPVDSPPLAETVNDPPNSIVVTDEVSVIAL